MRTVGGNSSPSWRKPSSLENFHNLLKAGLKGSIRFYQAALSPLFPPACRFTPTCSSYALEAVELHGVMKGTALAAGRILRCHPWNPGGYDPVPQLELKRNLHG